MLHIGCHLSSSKGFLAMGKTALSIGADTFQFFTRNPRGGKAKAVKPEDAAKPAMPTPAPVRQPEPEPAAVVSAVLARARKSIQQGQRVRRNGLVPAFQVLDAQELNAPSIGL